MDGFLRHLYTPFWILAVLAVVSVAHGAGSLIAIDSGASITTTGSGDVCADARSVESGRAFDGNWCGTPTLVELIYFTARGKGECVLLSWETASEIDNAGFHIHRSKTEAAGYGKITQALIPAKGSPTKCASYQFVDKNLEPGKTYYYKLEDVDSSGSRSYHGPVSAPLPAAIPTMTDTGLLLTSAAFIVLTMIFLRKRRRESQNRL